MKRLVLFLLLLAGTLGCGRKAPKSDLTPLTVEQWHILPKEEKFAPLAMERLKLGDPKFQNDEQWDYFARTVYIPAQQHELPNGLPKS